jgi:TetR/AcrR family transcriptional repressor of nem operon
VQQRGAETRSRLIGAAVRLLHDRSYTAAGVDDLCRLAAARKGSFYHFFPTKADLAIAAIDQQWTELKTEVFDPLSTTGAPGLDRVRRLVEATDVRQRRLAADRGAIVGCPFGNLGQEMAHQDGRIRSAVQTIFDGHCQFLDTWLAEAVRARQVALGSTADRARQLFALFEGALLLAKVAGDPGVFTQVCEAMPMIAGRVTPQVRAIGTPPELL